MASGEDSCVYLCGSTFDCAGRCSRSSTMADSGDVTAMTTFAESERQIVHVTGLADRVSACLNRRLASKVDDDATLSSLTSKSTVMNDRLEMTLLAVVERLESRQKPFGVRYLDVLETSLFSSQVPSSIPYDQRLCHLGYRIWNQIPVFDGTSPFGWIARAERFFRICQVVEEEKLSWLSLCFERDALFWYKRELASREFLNWCELKQRLLARFARVKSSSQREVKLQKELCSQIVAEPKLSCANISLQTETISEDVTSRKDASIVQPDSFPTEVSLLVLESGLSEKLLVDFETHRVFEVQKQAISEVVGPFFVDLQSGVDEFYEQTTGDNSTIYAYKVFDRIFLRGDVFGQAIQQQKRSKSRMFKYKAEIYVEGKLLIQLTYNCKIILMECIPYAREFIHFGKSFPKKGWLSFTGLFFFGGVNVWSTTVIWYELTSTKNTESWLNPLFERNMELNQFMEQNHNNPVRTSYKITKMQWKAFLIQVLNPFGKTGVKSSKLGFLPIKLSGSLGSWVLSLVDTHTQLGIVGCVVVVMVERAQQSQVVTIIGMTVLSLCSVAFMGMSKLYQGHQIHHLSKKQSLSKSRRFKFRITVILLEEEALEDVVPRCDSLNFLQEFDPSVRDYTPDGISQMGSLFERAIPAADFHVTESNIIWEGYREFEQGILATVDKAGVGKGNKQIQEFRSIFQRHLSVAYKAWEVEQGTDLDIGSDDLSKGSSQVTVANKMAQQMCSERVLFEGNISKKNELDDTEGMQMTAERCSRCSPLIVVLRFIIQAWHGDRYQLECITCGLSWYASGDEVATLTIHNEQPAMSRSLWRAIFCVWYCGKDQILQHMGITEGLFHPFNLRITMLLLENSFWVIEKDKRQNGMGMMMAARLRHTNLLIQLTCNLLHLHLCMAYTTVDTGGHTVFAIWHRWRIRDCVQDASCILEQCFQLGDKLHLKGRGIDRFQKLRDRHEKKKEHGIMVNTES